MVAPDVRTKQQNKWLVDEPEIKRIALDEESWVDVRTQITAGDYEDFMKDVRAANPNLNGNSSNENLSYPPSVVLKLALVGWNFVDSMGNILPLDIEHIRKLSMEASSLILDQVGDILGRTDPLVETDKPKKTPAK